MLSLFAVAPMACEHLLVRELDALGIAGAREAKGGVRFQCDWSAAMRAVLELRVASRVLLELSSRVVKDEAELYQCAEAVVWSDWFGPEQSIRVDCSGRHENIAHSGFAALKVKDAIVDHFRARGQRPDVDRDQPDIVVHLHLDRQHATLSLNLAAGTLHERAWRVAQVTAPLKENLAAALLLRAGWPELARDGGALLDPFCGGGTFLIEAIWMAAEVAPSWLRTGFAVERLRPAPSLVWRDLRAAIDARARQGLAGVGQQRFFAGDISPDAIHATKRNAVAAGVAGHIDLRRCEASQWSGLARERGLVICNPPYGERLADARSLLPIYRACGQTLRQQFASWNVAVLTTGDEYVEALGLPVRKRHKVMNGPLECQFVQLDPSRPERGQRPLPAGALMLANRLEKNHARLKSYLAQHSVSCYRLYDADLPEYSAAIDIYGERVHVQEYQAPRSIPIEDQQRRFKELLLAVAQVQGIQPEQIYSKQRSRQRGNHQYQRQARSDEYFKVVEGGLEFWVNLADFLDTGLFLDTRMVRSRLRSMTANKRFLNLFCYTGSATVYAAAGAASRSVSVDLSPTYLHWAEQNFELNRLRRDQHVLVEADAVRWLASGHESFDVIYLDPPTFSNSKRTPTVLDIQRDHVRLLDDCARRLAPNGDLVFVTNHRGFKLDPLLASEWSIDDWSRVSLPPDFARDSRLRQVYRMRRR